MSAPRAWFTRRSAATIAALCLVGQLCGLAHLLFVKHVQCATHGEVVHVARSVHASHGASRAAAPDAPLFAQDDRSAAFDRDEHCAWLTELRATRGSAAAIVLVSVGSAIASPGVMAGTAHVPARPLFRLAPKVSPPAHLA